MNIYTQKEEFGMKLEKLINKARLLFVEEMNILPKLELIATIQNLGLANHFHQEIKEALETLIADDNLNTSAPCFRLLRQNGYQVSPGNY